jgi:hypothetical protein
VSSSQIPEDSSEGDEGDTRQGRVRLPVQNWTFEARARPVHVARDERAPIALSRSALVGAARMLAAALRAETESLHYFLIAKDLHPRLSRLEHICPLPEIGHPSQFTGSVRLADEGGIFPIARLLSKTRWRQVVQADVIV